MSEKSESIFSLIVVFAVDEREVVVEECASFTAGFGETLLFEDDRWFLSVRFSLQCTKIIRTPCSKAGICGVGIFWSRFSDF